jgi:hypothetical protein
MWNRLSFPLLASPQGGDFHDGFDKENGRRDQIIFAKKKALRKRGPVEEELGVDD